MIVAIKIAQININVLLFFDNAFLINLLWQAVN